MGGNYLILIFILIYLNLIFISKVPIFDTPKSNIISRTKSRIQILYTTAAITTQNLKN